ncbi:hypothetical protein [Burkholderia sp. SRS-W-2-2016]|nr:hypothetical protein [Burkholderia sp. SRS-W-2-2016]
MKKIFALMILAATLGGGLSGCIVVPDGPGPHYHDHDRGHYDHGRY